MAANIITTAKPMLGGADAFAGSGGVADLTVSGAWSLDDTFSVTLTTPANGRTVMLGAGALTNQNPTIALTYKKKLYLLGGGQIMWFSALNEPTQFNDLNATGNSFMDLGNEYGFSDNVVGAAIFQGYIAAFARRSIQIVAVDANPDNNNVAQTLENIGTVNGDSVRGIGDKDVIFASDSGFRSLQVVNTNNKVTPYDVGTPIDALVVSRMLAVGTTQMPSIVEPFSNRYWCAIGNLIYVLSYFPEAGVTAWSNYDPSTPKTPVSTAWTFLPSSNYYITFGGLTVGKTYRYTRGAVELAATGGGQIGDASDTPYLLNADGTFVATTTTARVVIQNSTAPAAATCSLGELFTPEKFEERAGRVYVRDTDGMIRLYGSTDNNTYDDSVCSWETPWLDAKSAANKKLSSGVDAGMEGGWALRFGMDYVSGVLSEVYRNTASTFAKGVIPKAAKGTHFKVRGNTYGATYARFSVFALHFEGGDDR